MSENKLGRRVGTDKEFVIQNKIIKEFGKTKKWTVDNVSTARVVLKELLNDKKVSPTIRKSIAEFIISENKKYYKETGGKAKRKKVDQDKSFISLRCTDDKTGTGG